MSQARTSILVTGANQGLGFQVVKQLLTQAEDLHVYVGARTQEKAQDAVEKLKSINPSSQVEAVVVDLTDDNSIEVLAKKLKSLDILVNNAGAYVKEDFSSPQTVRKTLLENYNTNTFGTAALTAACLPLLTAKDRLSCPRHPAIINVSSGLASVSNMTTPSAPQYSSNEIFYSSSKTALNTFTIWLSKQHPSVRVVALSPGHTATALNGFTGSQSVETGAQYIVDAILDNDGPTGVHIQRNKVHPW